MIDTNQLAASDVGTKTLVLRSYIVISDDDTDPYRDDEFTIFITTK